VSTAVFLFKLIRRLLRYMASGVLAFAFDLFLVFLIIELFSLNYTLAIIIGFLIGTTLNYLFLYFWAYKGTKRNRYVGFAIFFSLALVISLLVAGSVTALVEIFGINLWISRIIVSSFFGFLNFLVSTFWNFRLL
jgi:putative flippase GtrA